MTRREAAETIFKYIRDNKFIPYDIEYGDGYFIFDMGADGVVHFKIKGLHGWKFAMWIETDPDKLKKDDVKDENGKDYPAIQFFCQHKLNIDKFKPTRSFFCVKYDLKTIERANAEDGSTWELYEIRDILKMIKRHPFITFTMDACEDQYYNKSYIKCYLDMRLFRTKQKIKEWISDTHVKIWHGFKVWFINKYKVVDKAELIDNNTDGWKSSPRYDMCIHFKKISDDEEIQQKAEIKMLDFWFHKDYYDNMDLILTREGIKGIYGYKIENKTN